MNAESPLAGRTVLVTRPQRQARRICALIEDAGGTALRFPTLEIEGIEPPPAVFSKQKMPHAFDWIIFISANAVYFACKACENTNFIPGGAKVAAIGRATAAALQARGIVVDLLPDEAFNSEALLASTKMHSVAGQSVLIVRGRGGREFLAETLHQRGAHVMYAEVYQRVRPCVEIESQLAAWRDRGIDAVTIFSGESLDNFIAMLGEDGTRWLREIPLVVAGRRIAASAVNRGFKQVFPADNATDWALFEALATIFGPDRARDPNPAAIPE